MTAGSCICDRHRARFVERVKIEHWTTEAFFQSLAHRGKQRHRSREQCPWPGLQRQARQLSEGDWIASINFGRQGIEIAGAVFWIAPVGVVQIYFGETGLVHRWRDRDVGE